MTSLNLTKSVAVVGTRSPFHRAMEVAEFIGRIAVESGYVVISGYATGLDIAAHWGAMDAEKPTIAVLVGSGIFWKEPHKPALERYIKAPRAYAHLMTRDRITGGLADIVIVVETETAGGTAHTAELARQQGRQVYAIQWGDNYPAVRKGTDELIEEKKAEALPFIKAIKDFERASSCYLCNKFVKRRPTPRTADALRFAPRAAEPAVSWRLYREKS